MLLKWYAKDPGHSAISANGRLHFNTHTLLTQRSQNEWSNIFQKILASEEKATTTIIQTDQQFLQRGVVLQPFEKLGQCQLGHAVARDVQQGETVVMGQRLAQGYAATKVEAVPSQVQLLQVAVFLSRKGCWS